MFEQNFAQHFHSYFSIQIADTPELIKAVHKLRYDVYCAELQYEKDCPLDCEIDSFDEYSKFVLITHRPTGVYAGCVRLVIPPASNRNALMPFEANCLPMIKSADLSFLANQDRHHIGELSRLSVLNFFRRRAGEENNPYGFNLGIPPDYIVDIDEKRSYPLIAIALYMASASIAINNNIQFVLVMMEPRLAKHLSRYGICFMQISEAIDYHGERALFYIDNPTLVANFKSELEEFYQLVDSQLKS